MRTLFRMAHLTTRSFLPAAVLAMLGSALPNTASAQQQGGMFGNRTMGRSFSPRTSSFNQGGASTFGGGGGNGVVGSGMGAGGAAGNGGQLTGNERFIRGNRQGQFVGSDAADAQNAMAGQSYGGDQGFGGQDFGGGQGLGGGQGFGGPGGRFNNPFRNQSGMQQMGPDAASKVRTALRVAFPSPQIPAGAIQEAVVARLERSLADSFVTPINVEMVDGVLVLRGTIATKHARHLAELLAGLEPGVGRVQNDLLLANLLPPSPNIQAPPN